MSMNTPYIIKKISLILQFMQFYKSIQFSLQQVTSEWYFVFSTTGSSYLPFLMKMLDTSHLAHCDKWHCQLRKHSRGVNLKLVSFEPTAHNYHCSFRCDSPLRLKN